MKKSIALWVLSLCASLIFAASFEIEGKAVIAQVMKCRKVYLQKQ